MALQLSERRDLDEAEQRLRGSLTMGAQLTKLQTIALLREIDWHRTILKSVAACEAHYDKSPRGYIVPDIIMNEARKAVSQ